MVDRDNSLSRIAEECLLVPQKLKEFVNPTLFNLIIGSSYQLLTSALHIVPCSAADCAIIQLKNVN